MAAGAVGEARGAVEGTGRAQGVDPELGLAAQGFVECEVPLGVHRRAVVAQAFLGQCRELARERDRGITRLARRHDACDQAEVQRLVGVHRPSR